MISPRQRAPELPFSIFPSGDLLVEAPPTQLSGRSIGKGYFSSQSQYSHHSSDSCGGTGRNLGSRPATPNDAGIPLARLTRLRHRSGVVGPWRGWRDTPVSLPSAPWALPFKYRRSGKASEGLALILCGSEPNDDVPSRMSAARARHLVSSSLDGDHTYLGKASTSDLRCLTDGSLHGLDPVMA